MSDFNNLLPKELWQFFSDILEIPRPSDHESRIRDHLLEFARKNKLYSAVDKAGNLIIRKPAIPGLENNKSVCLQSHLDMVCEKNSETQFDFLSQPISAYVENGWIRSKGTTLGADDGIGIAAQMAILASTDIPHGPVECLFTVAEETGLTGAFGLENDFIQSKVLLNLDSEDEGELFIGCAGGIDLTAWFDYEQEPIPDGSAAFKLSISGLKGGHSGDDIHKGLGNANKILSRFLWEYSDELMIRINSFEGGNLRNAIAREAVAIIVLPALNENILKDSLVSFMREVKIEFSVTEPDMEFSIQETGMPAWVIDEDTHFNLLNALYACPHGVLAWSQNIPGLVETSTNLAAVRFEDERIKITTSQRSSLKSAKKNMSNMVESVFLLAGAYTEKSTGYPGWNPNPDSPILHITREAFKDLFGQEPLVKAIHAGLECGLFLEKYPGLDMISFGPTIKGAHSPDERLDIVTVGKFWNLLCEVLKRIPENE